MKKVWYRTKMHLPQADYPLLVGAVVHWNLSNNLLLFIEEIHCPFRGCAGDWVKLGVAKRHGAVLGDAVSKMADENTKVQLVESDIPGAELPKPAEFCTVAILKRWLSCRGAKVSGNRMSFSYKRLTLASLGKVWNFLSGEFLQLFVHPGTQQLNLPILHLTTSTKTQGNEEFKQMASPKTAPWRFATPNLTQSPAQPRNGQYEQYGGYNLF